jgi:hypothetical protein
MAWYGAPPTPWTAIVATRWWQLDRAPAEYAQTESVPSALVRRWVSFPQGQAPAVAELRCPQCGNETHLRTLVLKLWGNRPVCVTVTIAFGMFRRLHALGDPPTISYRERHSFTGFLATTAVSEREIHSDYSDSSLLGRCYKGHYAYLEIVRVISF